MTENDWEMFKTAQPGKVKWGLSKMEPIDIAILMFGARNCWPLDEDDPEDAEAIRMMAERGQRKKLTRSKELRKLIQSHCRDWESTHWSKG